MTEQEWDELKEREIDESLSALFKSTGAPAPRPGFAARTMHAVRREPLPAGRRRLGARWTAPLAWAALLGGSAAVTLVVAVTQPVGAASFAAVVGAGVRLGVWVMGLAGTAASWTSLFSATGFAVARAVATRNGSLGLIAIVVVGALSLTALRRLLISESEASSWQELS